MDDTPSSHPLKKKKKEKLVQESMAYHNLDNILHLAKFCFVTMRLQNCSYLYGWQKVKSETCQVPKNPRLTLKQF